MPELLPTRKLAEKIVAELAPFCELIDVAGSIRRGRDWVNDIDLVVLPKSGQDAALIDRCRRNAALIKSGPQCTILRLANEVQLDLWIAHGEQGDMFAKKPTNYGSLLLCRTGSVRHNIYLVEHAKKLGLKWDPHHGVFHGETLLASATEMDIFNALGLAFVKPEQREL